MSHHYSGPQLGFPHGDARLDLTDLFAFPKPGGIGKSVLILNLHPSFFLGFGQSDAPPPSSYAYTFDHLARTIDNLLGQLKINKCGFYLHDYGGPIGFRFILAHPERVQALIIQNANAYKESLGAKWAGSAQYWADPKTHPEVFDPGNARFRRICSTITRRTSFRIRLGKHRCASTSRRPWWSGDGTIPRSLPLGQRRSSAICWTPRSICSMLAISLWTGRTTRLQT